MYYLSERSKYGELILLVDKSEIDSSFNNIMNIVRTNFNNNYPTFVCVCRSSDSNADPSSNYLYSKEQMKKLSELNVFLHQNGYSYALKFSEINDIKNVQDFNSAWPFESVFRANRDIDKIVDYMHKLKLTPFEAVLYAHMYVGSFQYNDSGKSSKWYQEISRVILGMAINQKFIVCAGHASYAKAIIDKYNDFNLSCEFLPIQRMNNYNLHIGGHEQLSITLNDDKYNISGMYGDDICLNVYNDNIPDISACLFPLEDINNFKNFTTRIIKPSDRYEEIIAPSQDGIFDEDVQKYINEHRGMDMDLVTQTIKRRFERVINKNAIHSEPIPYDKYIDALFTLKYKQYCLEYNIPFDKNFNLSDHDSDRIDDHVIDSFNMFLNDVARKSIVSAQSLFSPLKSRNTFCLAPYIEKDPFIQDLKFSQ